MRQLILCNPRGFCAGVVRAIQVVEKALETWGPPIYVKHEIVHNSHVVDNLKERGAVFIEDLKEAPSGSRIIYSAHGVSPKVREEAKAHRLIDIDATCVLVTKIHSAVKLYASRGYHVILIGKKKHVEIIGICGEVPNQVTVVENVDDVMQLSFDSRTPLFFVTQTTLSLDDVDEITKALKLKYPQIITLPSSSVCYATQNRQEALRTVLPRVNFVYVVGDIQSSNSNRLKEIASKRGIPSRLINSPDHIFDEILNYSGDIAMTAGASTPEHIVQACVSKLQELIPDLQVTEDIFVVEDVVFQLPKELRK
ncbi:4-hydroxy-3-methylbut-2-enyl diphosphate reductase [Chlamydia avium]|uniref:4-hydroxy-3-methylbut-2-enyl diphosphate reductase n=1 Tax=Chlamydia avium TaxID=1457141 RepID=A0ABN0MS60_9CHLA|nr:4-hydroxy-3-methylbut-2-enyl diphosphate reductase [Chlamydia avium]EPP37576.1 4-hydroxy-3-methylbut-2-enyl diphosphate reductase [Chlamydia psittaci 10_743_SC13]EPP38327.1 4-hydroxy-3-methylbut-2-enyl diphosphate reductase [Chlamydia avium]VVT42977.1 4-hydroxy-3-methylbut-2-enyl diphosphate reductase [Chlamydia avium]